MKSEWYWTLLIGGVFSIACGIAAFVGHNSDFAQWYLGAGVVLALMACITQIRWRK